MCWTDFQFVCFFLQSLVHKVLVQVSDLNLQQIWTYKALTSEYYDLVCQACVLYTQLPNFQYKTLSTNYLTIGVYMYESW